MGEALEGLEIEVLKGVKEGRYTQGRVREEMKGLVGRLSKLEVQMGDIEARTSKEKAEMDQRLCRLEREDKSETDAFLRMESSLEEVRAGLQDCQLSRRNNLVFHGLPVKGEETQATLAEDVRHILHSKLGIGRAVQITRVARLGQSQTVLGCQPLLVTFLQHSHKDEVFRKAALLPRLSGILISEDLPKSVLLTSPREKLPVCSSLTGRHPNKEWKENEEMSGKQDNEGYKDNISVQQVKLLEAERDFVEAEDKSENNDDRVKEAAEKGVSGEHDEIVSDPGKENRSEARYSYEGKASPVNYSIGAKALDDSRPLGKDTIKSDEKVDVIVKEFDEAEIREKDEKEAIDEGGLTTSENFKDNAVFEFFD